MVKAADLKPGDRVRVARNGGLRTATVVENRLSATVKLRENGELAGKASSASVRRGVPVPEGEPARLIIWREENGDRGGDHVHPGAEVRAG